MASVSPGNRPRSCRPIELVAYAGAAALVLAITGAAFGFGMGGDGLGRGLLGYFVVAALLVIILAWVSPTARSVMASLPAFAATSSAGSGRCSVSPSRSLQPLGSNGLRQSRQVTNLSRPPPPAAHAVGGSRLDGGPLVAIFVLRQQHRVAFSGGYWSDVRQAIWIPALLVGITLAALVVSRLRGRVRKPWPL